MWKPKTMNTVTISVDELNQFFQDSAATFEKFAQAQSILSQMPELAKEAFDFSSRNKPAADVIDNALNSVIYRVNANFFMRHAKFKDMIPHSIKVFNELMTTPVTNDNLIKVLDAINNVVDPTTVLNNVLAKGFESDQFKTIMRIDSSNCEGKRTVMDLVFVAAALNGEHNINVDEIKYTIEYLPKGNEFEFDLGIKITHAKNGNMTVKINKDLVSKLNNIVS